MYRRMESIEAYENEGNFLLTSIRNNDIQPIRDLLNLLNRTLHTVLIIRNQGHNSHIQVLLSDLGEFVGGRRVTSACEDVCVRSVFEESGDEGKTDAS